MGGSSSSDVKTTEIATTTTSTVGDIGLTGQNAVDMAAILQTGEIERARVHSKSVDKLVQESGSSTKQLIGGASDLIVTSGSIISGLSETLTGLANTSGDIAKGGSDMLKLAPYAVVAVIGFMAITMHRRRK